MAKLIYVRQDGTYRGTQKYALYHVYQDVIQGVSVEKCSSWILRRASFDHVTGYIKGATVGQWAHYHVHNGWPAQAQVLLPRAGVVPYAEWRRVIEASGLIKLASMYPDLLSSNGGDLGARRKDRR